MTDRELLLSRQTVLLWHDDVGHRLGHAVHLLGVVKLQHLLVVLQVVLDVVIDVGDLADVELAVGLLEVLLQLDPALSYS